MSLLEQTVRDGIELAASGADVVEDEDLATLRGWGIRDLQQSAQRGGGGALGPSGSSS